MLKENLEIKEYTLKKFLGRGGFGEVWLAEKKIEIADKKVPVALKFLSGENQRISDYASVRREINTWIDASGNKNVVSVLDGFIFDEMFVIVSEYADGGSLRGWLRRNGGKSPDLARTVEIMGGILDGLSHLHSQKIIHRDLKPENILLKGDVPCIADFGVSRIIETVSLTSSNFGTNSAGSPLYMSPESFERVKPAPQIDIWSAGVMLFEMLNGKTPYAADTIPSLIYEIVTKEPRSLSADVPENIQNVVKKALAKELSGRFSTAREMRDALMKAFYSQNSPQPFVPEEFISTQKKQFIPEVSSAETLPVGFEKGASENGQSKNTSKKLYGWIGLGAGAVLAVSIGIFLFSMQNNSNQINFSNSAQTANSEKTTIANSENANAVDSNENLQITGKITEKQQEKEVEEKSVQTPRPTRAKADPAPTKAAPKPTTKKKVTLDDIIN
ncbi:MAG: serine/threonine protein kinase [Pyrinomonadaceae bacterium]